MSYNIMNKRASFQGTISGSIEDMVDNHTTQIVNGQKTFTDLSASTVYVANDLTASGIISASVFYGDGTGLSGVTVTPDGSNTEVQFNADNAFGASSNFTFNTGSNALTITGDITASVNISASAFFGDGTGLTNVTTDVSASDLIGTLSASQIDYASPLTKSAGNLTLKFASANSGLTDSSGIKLDFGGLVGTSYVNTYNVATEDTSGNHFKITLGTIGSNIQTSATNITAGTLNNARLPSSISVTSVSASTGLSASADVQVGGNIVSDTGDLDVNTAKAKRFKLLSVGDEDTLLDLTSGSYAGTGFSTISMFNSASNALRETVTITSDTLGVGPFFRLQTNAASPIVQVQMWQGQISASADLQVGGHITGSALHTNGGITMPDGGGGTFTFLSDQGNVTAGSIEMLAGGSDVLNFNDNSISGSGNISGSAFHGDGSALTGIAQASRTFYYLRVNAQLNLNPASFPWFLLDGSGQANPPNQLTRFVAPASGSVERVLYTPSIETNAGEGFETGDTPVFFFRKNDVSNNINNLTMHTTASTLIPFSYKNDSGTVNTNRVVFDTIGGNPVVTGSTNFDPGDILIFGGYNPQDTLDEIGITIVLSFDES